MFTALYLSQWAILFAIMAIAVVIIIETRITKFKERRKLKSIKTDKEKLSYYVDKAYKIAKKIDDELEEDFVNRGILIALSRYKNKEACITERKLLPNADFQQIDKKTADELLYGHYEKKKFVRLQDKITIEEYERRKFNSPNVDFQPKSKPLELSPQEVFWLDHPPFSHDEQEAPKPMYNRKTNENNE